MEAELICGACKKLLDNPVNLPCSHSICYSCTSECVTQITAYKDSLQRKTRESDVSVLPINEILNDRTDCQSDDSGYLSIQEIHACLHQQLKEPLSQVRCPTCNIHFILDDRGIDCLPKNVILDELVEKHKSKSADIYCQLCETTPSLKATVTCEQCQVSYCDKCLTLCHPKRGPLALHSLIIPTAKQIHFRRQTIVKCNEHEDENISMYCVLCKMPVCYLCFEEGRHSGHEAKALGTMYKEQKAEMKKVMNTLSKKNRCLNDFLKTLNVEVSKVQENGIDFESRVVAQIDEVISILEKKKNELLSTISQNTIRKMADLTEQEQLCKTRHQEIKGLIEYSQEVINETDPAIFLMISNPLIGRLLNTVDTLIGKEELTPYVNSEMQLDLSTRDVIDAIHLCKFTKSTALKIIDKPCTPVIETDRCSVISNTMTLKWAMADKSAPAEGYHIDVDDGLGGEFQAVHSTDETICTLGGLQFKSTYKARVQAYNAAGESSFSNVIYLTTPDVAAFDFDPDTSHPDIIFSNNNQTMTTTSFENRVALGSVGFSRGLHYWEVTIDRYEGNPDPAIGIAQEDCAKDVILGKDDKAWSVYVDNTRSWFQHNNAHLYRSEGGIEVGSAIGLLLDLDHCRLTLYRNDEKHGPIEFPSLQDIDVVYPAFSLNRNVTMTLYTGLIPPEQ